MIESVEIARRLDAIYDTELTNRLVSSLSSPSYTLADLEALIREWLPTTPIPVNGDLTRELVVSNLLAWLVRREKETNVNQKS